MELHVAGEQGARLDEALETLLRGEPHLAYANFPPIAAQADGTVRLHRRWWRPGEGRAVLVARDANQRPLAALRLEPREFESRHFGVRMAKIEPPAAVREEHPRLAALRALYAAACDALRGEGYRHVSAVSSTQDRITCWVLQELGFFHVGTKISWMAPLDGQRAPSALPAALRIEAYDRSMLAALAPASWHRLREWTGSAFDRGPFVFDLNVPGDRAAAVYQVWTEKALTGEWADVVLAVHDGAEIVAFNAMQLLADLSEAAGVGILGRGIGASLPGYHGLFTALQKECAATRPLGAGFLENETQAATVPTINVFGKLGHQCLRSIASFHLRWDDDPAALGSGANRSVTGADTGSHRGRSGDT
jgi:hypothetical protein